MEPVGPKNGEAPTPVELANNRLAAHREALDRLRPLPAPLSVVEDDAALTRRRRIRDQPPQIRRKKRP